MKFIIGKKISRLIVTRALLAIGSMSSFVACVAPTNPIPTGQVFSFKFINWPNTTGTLQLIQFNTPTTVVGTTPIATDGSFSFTLPTAPPLLSAFVPGDIPTGCTISDKTALAFQSEPQARVSTESFWRNVVITNRSSISDYSTGAQVLIGTVYFDRAVTMKGLCTYLNNTPVDLSFVKGWNYMITEVINASNYKVLAQPNQTMNAILGDNVASSLGLQLFDNRSLFKFIR